MGKFPAVLPGDCRYARNHMWFRSEGDRLRFGFTSYAVRLMQDVYFLDWVVSDGDAVELLQQIGHIETSKAVSDLFAPMSGAVASFNQELLKDPTPINLDTYGGLVVRDGRHVGETFRWPSTIRFWPKMGKDATPHQGQDQHRGLKTHEPFALPSSYHRRPRVKPGRALEESIAAANHGIGPDVSVVPYLYDLHPDHTAACFSNPCRATWWC